MNTPMPGRIITLQRQLRELGRIRTGYSEEYTDKHGKPKRRAVRAKTFILTAPVRDQLDIAADLWGGEVERWQPQGAGPEVWRLVTEQDAIDAILPPGDPLSQYYEMWNRGGAIRRCNGERDEKSGRPCVCRAEFGEDWFERSKTEVCQPHTRLNVFLPLADFGYWRIETHSYYAAVELTGSVDLIKGRIGLEAAVPIRLRIDHRVKVDGGRATPFPVPVIELRNVSTLQVLAGVAPVLQLDGTAVVQPAQVGAGVERQAIGAAPEQVPVSPAAAAVPDYRALANEARSADAVKALWRQANQAGHLTEELDAHLKARVTDLDYSDPTDADDATVASVEWEMSLAAWSSRIAKATTLEALRAVWKELGAAGVSDQVLKDQWWQRSKALKATGRGDADSEPAPAAGPVVAEAVVVEPDMDAVWMQVLSEAGRLGWDTPTVQQRFADRFGMQVSEAKAGHMQEFLNAMKSGAVQ